MKKRATAPKPDRGVTKMIQIRNVPGALHGRLKAQAARAGMSLSDYLLRELERIGETPTVEEWLDLVRSDPPVELDRSVTEWIREGRDAS